nr:two pore domain potassium channel family protein [uncultured Sphingomonas sp.]
MEQPESAAVELGVQLALGAGMVLLMVLVHASGLLAISRYFRLGGDRLRDSDVNPRTLLMLTGLGGCVFALHIVEIVIFAGFYLAVGALSAIDEALYYSASAYATLGRTTDFFPEDWRLMGALEALVGFILIGWSTALMVGAMRKLEE